MKFNVNVVRSKAVVLLFIAATLVSGEICVWPLSCYVILGIFKMN